MWVPICRHFLYFSVCPFFSGLLPAFLRGHRLYRSQSSSLFRAVKRLRWQEGPEPSERRCSSLAVRKCWKQWTKLVSCLKEFLLENVWLSCLSKISLWVTQKLRIVTASPLCFSLNNSIMAGLMAESWRGFSTYQQVSNLGYWVFRVLRFWLSDCPSKYLR